MTMRRPAAIHEPPGRHQSRKAAASGWIGSALEYYDFFIYATAAALIFPQIFFPSENPKVAIIASLATYGVGYVARPIGAFVLGHWGDTHGRKYVLILCMFLMGISTMARRPAADLQPGRPAGAGAPRHPAAGPGLRGRRRDLGRELDDPRARALRPARLLRQLHAAGRAGRADPRRRGLPAAGALHARHGLQQLGLAHPVPAQLLRHHRRLDHPPRGRRDAGLQGGGRAQRRAALAGDRGLPHQLARHDPRRLHVADEHDPGRHHRLRRRLRGAARLRHRLPQGRLPLDPGARQHPRGASSSRSSATSRTRSAAGRRSSSARSARACSPSATSTPSRSTTCRSPSSCRS